MKRYKAVFDLKSDRTSKKNTDEKQRIDKYFY